MSLLVLRCCYKVCAEILRKPNNSTTEPGEGGIVSSTNTSNPEPPSPVPGPILESVVVQEQISEGNDRLPSYGQVIENRTRLKQSEVCPQILDPPSYDEVIVKLLVESEVFPRGNCWYAPPSYETAVRNERNGVYYA